MALLVRRKRELTRTQQSLLNDCADEPSALASLIPPDCLTEVRCYKGSHNPEHGGQDNPVGSYLFPGYRNFAITPATNPIIVVQNNTHWTSDFSLCLPIGVEGASADCA